MYEDKTLVCVECGKEFIFSAGEQKFYAEKQLMNEPKRCKACHDARKKAKGAPRAPREQFETVCAKCGGPAFVPFKPEEGKPPVLCSACHAERQKGNL